MFLYFPFYPGFSGICWEKEMTRRENIFRAIRFERPEYIPMKFHIKDTDT